MELAHEAPLFKVLILKNQPCMISCDINGCLKV